MNNRGDSVPKWPGRQWRGKWIIGVLDPLLLIWIQRNDLKYHGISKRKYRRKHFLLPVECFTPVCSILFEHNFSRFSFQVNLDKSSFLPIVTNWPLIDDFMVATDEILDLTFSRSASRRWHSRNKWCRGKEEESTKGGASKCWSSESTVCESAFTVDSISLNRLRRLRMSSWRGGE